MGKKRKHEPELIVYIPGISGPVQPPPLPASTPHAPLRAILLALIEAEEKNGGR